MPTLTATAKLSEDKKTRIVTTASCLHQLGHIQYDTLVDGPKRQGKLRFLLYSQSKYVRSALPLIYKPTY